MDEEKQSGASVLREAAGRGGTARRRRRQPKERCRNGVRSELVRLLGKKEVQQQIAEALVREATEGSRPGSAVKAFEVIRDTIGEKPGKQEKPEWNPKCVDLSALSVEELLELLR